MLEAYVFFAGADVYGRSRVLHMPLRTVTLLCVPDPYFSIPAFRVSQRFVTQTMMYL